MKRKEKKRKEKKEKKKKEEKKKTFFNLLQCFVERLLVLGFEKLSAKMKKALCGEGDGDDDGANSGHHPRRSELQSLSFFSSATHFFFSLFVLYVFSLCLSLHPFLSN